MITNQRLLINEGIPKDDAWFVKLDKIKEIIVKKGIIGKMFGTGKCYPITDDYPYTSKRYACSEGGMNKSTKVFNIVQGNFEVTELELYNKSRSHPHLDVMKQPYVIKKILEEAIVGTGINYINCEYCRYRFDVNKSGKCPNCGAPQS